MTRPSRRQLVWHVLILLNALRVYASNVEWNCPSECNCKWISGRRQATCDNQGLRDVPVLSDQIQALLLDNNLIHTLKNDVFYSQQMVNLQKLSLRNSSIEVIEKNAFRNLAIVIEIDLNYNNIARLDPNTFKTTERLRVLFLNGNKIQKIEDGLFYNLTFIQQIELNDNQISHISPKAFVNLPKLTTLKLNGNRLTLVKSSVFESLPELRSLDLKNNPWNCDCHMRNFVVWFKQKNLYTHPTQCSQPSYLENASWNSIDKNAFACKPEIVSFDHSVDADNERVYLSCKVLGDPKPETHVMFNSRVLNNNTLLQPNGERKYANYEFNDNEYRFNVTVFKVSRLDYGMYICSARNEAGLVEKNLTFNGESTSIFTPLSTVGDVWVLLLCLVIGILCALLLIFMLCFLCCRRTDTIATKKPSSLAVTTNGDLTHHIIMEPEQQKTLLTAVNPVQKPPRKYDSSPQSDNGGTELTELNRNLLDDSSILGGMNGGGDSMDDHRSTNSLEQLSSCNSQDNLLLQERFRPVATRIHPPDLLAFSSRRLQASPAGSSASNETETTRFRALHSPVRSPIYQVHPYTPPYDTLPYSRTQSPFSPTGSSNGTTPIITHRQGYVTIPRRPRVASWSRDATTPTLEAALGKGGGTAAEPVYDNLGPRTTADGSSVLSLPRRISVESAGSARAPRAQAPSPLYTSHTLPHKAKLNHVYLSIRENAEPQFHPVKESSGVIRPLPLHLGEAEAKRSSWAQPSSRATPETGTLKRPTNEMNGGSTPPSTTKSKVPPKPPPKPKKNGPLFEDEGEDGTEV